MLQPRNSIHGASKLHRSAGIAVSAVMSLFVFLGVQQSVQGGDWAQWRGPNRDGISTETDLLKQWPKAGPKLAARVEGLGAGFSTPAIADGKVYMLATLNSAKSESLIALSESTGKKLWATPVGNSTGGHAAPRSTPTVDGKRVYVLSSDGKLLCADSRTGREQWKVDLKKEYRGTTGSWAYAESVLIDGDALIVTPGGSEAVLVALNKTTGKTIWQSELPSSLAGRGRRGYHTAGYSSAIVATVDGVKQYIQFVNGGVIGVAAKDGAFLWNYSEPANGTANCSTPIFHNNAVFAASAYGNGGGRADLTKSSGKWSAKPKYFTKSMQNHHGGMILIGDHVYGTGNGGLLCVNYKSGEIVWKDRSVGKGSVAYADGHLIVRSESGPIALVVATPDGYQEKGRFDQPERSSKKAWAHPVIANGKLYIRDWDKLFVYDVKAK
jgi:outer membrane protein assembly factor BamB